MLTFIVVLEDLVKVNQTAEVLGNNNQLEVVFDILANLKHLPERHDLWIVEGFKAAMYAKNYMIAVKVYEEYSLSLLMNERDVSGSLINSLRADSCFMEVKLVLVDELLVEMPFDTILDLLSAFESQLEGGYLTTNTNFMLVSFQIFILSQKIGKRFNRLETRLKNFQDDLLELVKKVLGALGDSPIQMQAVLKSKDHKGRQLIDMLLEAEVYEFMEERIVEQAIRLSWLGKTNFDGKVMETSTAYKQLFQNDLGKKEDAEAKLRPDIFSFNRKVVPVESYKAHEWSYRGFFARMKMMYNFDLQVLFFLITVYHMILIMLFMMIDNMKPSMAKYMQFMMTQDPNAITMGEIDEMRDMGEMFPGMWKNLLLSQSWICLAPFVIINRYAYAKLTKQPFRF